MGGGPCDHPLCPGLQPGPSSQTPESLGQRCWSVSQVTSKSGVSEVGVFRTLQPNEIDDDLDKNIFSYFHVSLLPGLANGVFQKHPICSFAEG